ncbi:MAG: hypothetical protein ACYTAN_17250 [Planctomycetota bacterium]|jgi:hypothetical protein
MADEQTRADSLWWYLTGAASHGGAQADPDLSIGNHQSSSITQVVDWNVTSPISNITIEFIDGANGLGAGSLTAPSANTLRWTAPGGVQGPAVTIANGETKIIEDDDPNKYIRVERTDANPLTGTATVTISELANNVIGMDDVTSAEQGTGKEYYRCACLENMSSVQVQDIKVKLATLGTQVTSDVAWLAASGADTIETTGSFADWPEEGYALMKSSAGAVKEMIYYSSRTATELTVPAAGRGLGVTSAQVGTATDTADAIPGIEIGKDAPTSQPSGNFETPADEFTAPSGVTFLAPITDANAIDIGNLNANEIYGLWIHRIIPAGATATINVLHHILVDFDAA